MFHAVQGDTLVSAEQLRIGEINRFEFSNWAGPDLPVWIFVPENADPATAPILIVMHGNKRDPHRYLRDWVVPAREHGIVVFAPEFSREDFPGSRGYNTGYLFDADDVPRDESLWTFSAIEPLFDTVRTALGSVQERYSIYGHSAGSQFVHRYLFFKPEARVERYIAANAGWYTLPALDIAFPYGLDDSVVSEETLVAAVGKPVFVLLGDQDNDPNHDSLRRTPEAMDQGRHRFARGLSFYEAGARFAEDRGLAYEWKLGIVEDVAHSNGGMAEAAAVLVQ